MESAACPAPVEGLVASATMRASSAACARRLSAQVSTSFCVYGNDSSSDVTSSARTCSCTRIARQESSTATTSSTSPAIGSSGAARSRVANAARPDGLGGGGGVGGAYRRRCSAIQSPVFSGRAPVRGAEGSVTSETLGYQRLALGCWLL